MISSTHNASGHDALANDFRYMSSRLSECATRAELLDLIPQWQAIPDDGDVLRQQVTRAAANLGNAVVQFQNALQALANRDMPGLDCYKNYTYGSADFQELDPMGDYEETMLRMNQPGYWEPAPAKPVERKPRLRWWVQHACRLLTWRPVWMLRLGGRPINFPTIRVDDT